MLNFHCTINERSSRWKGPGPIFSTFALLLVAAGCTNHEQNASPAEILLAESIAYHDPGGTFMKHHHRFTLRETRPNRPDRHTTVVIDGHGTGLTLEQQRDGYLIEATIDLDGCQAKLDGSEAIPDSLAQRYRLTCEGLAWVRDFYGFLLALPMKLTEPGTHINPSVTDTTFQGAPAQMLHVTFDSAVGTDTWWFFFDPVTHAIMGYRFVHNDQPGEGEYVVMEGELEVSGIRIPKTRHWYMYADDRYLGDDIVEGYEAVD